MKTATCRSCHAPIQWALTRKGHRMPLNTVPVEATQHGAQVVLTGLAYLQCLPLEAAVEEIALMEGLNTKAARTLIEQGDYEAFTSHFSTCEHGHEWRTGRG